MSLQGTYRLKYYIHASHAIRWEDGIGEEHGHSWEITAEFQDTNDEMIIFDKIEKKLGETFQVYSGAFLNNVDPFRTINPTLENITKEFFQLIERQIRPLHAKLNRVEVGESPTRFYYVTRDELNK